MMKGNHHHEGINTDFIMKGNHHHEGGALADSKTFYKISTF